jgi:hypothetical protein
MNAAAPRMRVRVHLRLLALALAIAWVLGPLSTALHGGRHAHRYCAEHRAFEEGWAPALTDEPGRGTAQPAVLLDFGSSASVDHVKCPAAPPSVRDSGVPAVHRAAPASHFSKAELGEPRLCDRVAPIEHLALAPKSSPPRASSVVEA